MVTNRLRVAVLLGFWIAVLLTSPRLWAQTVAPHDLQNIAEKPIAVFWTHPSEHLKNPVLASLFNELKDLSQPSRDQQILINLPKIDSIKVSFGMGRTVWSPMPMPQAVVLYHTTDAATATVLFTSLTQGLEAKTTPEWKTPIYSHANRLGPPGQEPKDPDVWKLQNGVTQLDPQTIVQTDNVELMLKTLAAKTPAAPPAWGSDFAQLAKGQSLWMIDLSQIRGMLKDEQGPPGGMEAMIYGNMKSLWENSDYAFISLDTTNGIQLSAMAQSANAESAQRFKGTIEGLLGIAKGLLPMAKQGTEQLNKMSPGMGTMLYSELENTVNGIKITQAGTQTKLTLGISQEFLAKVPALLLPAIKSARAQALKMQSLNNLKQIVLAMHNYLDANKGIFPAAVMLGPDGKTPHSWRVAILPYIEESALYQQYKFDEPWDSENNKKVAATIPRVYRSALATNGPNCTSYVVLTHPNGVFNSTPGSGTKIRQISDGTSKTIAVVEANAEIPWTKPEDLPIVDGQPLPKLGIPGATTFNAAFCDGSVHSLSIAIKEELLRNLVGKNDGNVINFDELEAPEHASPGAVPGSAPAKAMPAPPPGAPGFNAPAPPMPVPAPAPPVPLPAPAPPAFPAPPAPKS